MSDSQSPLGDTTGPVADPPAGTSSERPSRCPFCASAAVRLDTSAPIRGRTVTLDCDACSLSWNEEITPQALEALWRQAAEKSAG